MSADATGRLEARLAAIEQHLAALAPALAQAGEVLRLAERLEHETAARRALAEQTAWLIEVLGDARREIRWLKQERERLMSRPHGG